MIETMKRIDAHAIVASFFSVDIPAKLKMLMISNPTMASNNKITITFPITPFEWYAFLIHAVTLNASVKFGSRAPFT